jgi:NDP-sugar pyrophosphorylase family protein
MVERTIELFARADVEVVTVLVEAEECYGIRMSAGAFDKVNVKVVSDIFPAIAEELKAYAEKGVEHSFIVSGNVYAEADLLDLFYFHREARQAATRGIDREGPLDLWVVDCAKAQLAGLDTLLNPAQETGVSYFIRDYVSRLTHPRDLRRLVSDALSGRCAMRPLGREIKPGIWMDEGAEIHRRARIVAPAYIGCGARVQEDTLITRCSNIEKHCFVDCGSVIEDSSILANTHIGIWLDVCHAVASGNKLLSLGHEVVVEISDLSVMRSNGESKSAFDLSFQCVERQAVATARVAAVQREQPSAPETWQLGANPIQG